MSVKRESDHMQDALMGALGVTLDEYEPKSEDSGPESKAEETTSEQEASTETEEQELGAEQEAVQVEEPTEAKEESDEETQEESIEEPQVESHVEYVYASGPTGRKKIKVDYSNRDLIKRAFQKAVAADKYRLERDEIKKNHSSTQEKVQVFEELNEVFAKQGAAGVLQRLGGQEALDELLDQRMQERERIEQMSDAERTAYEKDLEIQSKEDHYKKLQEELESVKTSLAEKAKQEEIKQLESLVHPAYNRYNFEGKIGNEKQEFMLNKMLWDQAEQEIEAIPDDVPLTKALVDRIYRDAAKDVRSLVEDRVKETSKKVAVKRKVAATEAAQTAVAKKMVPKSKEHQLDKAINEGDFSSAMSLYFGKK